MLKAANCNGEKESGPMTRPEKVLTSSKVSEKSLFLKRAFSNPLRLGAAFPSSRYLGKEIARHVNSQETYPVLELGGGTGALTDALLASGVDPSRLYIVELDTELCQFLENKFPDSHVIHGCAGNLEAILPKSIQGRIKATVSGLPLLNFPKDAMSSIIDSVFNVMTPDGHMLQYTYSPTSSLPAELFGLQKNRVGTVFRNVPPATVWKYYK